LSRLFDTFFLHMIWRLHNRYNFPLINVLLKLLRACIICSWSEYIVYNEVKILTRIWEGENGETWEREAIALEMKNCLDARAFVERSCQKPQNKKFYVLLRGRKRRLIHLGMCILAVLHAPSRIYLRI
jgi:hypothetical protein